ncbi:crAss001_48 related protein [Vibrio cholerae]|uniref:crAss001_48 related protein n=1 Tax=Vibrio cholerae TaxID=666 RepID=UPI003080A984
MEPHQQRVVEEKKELDSKIEKLNTFIDGQVFKKLDNEDKKLLIKQLHEMKAYSRTLGCRIRRFELSTEK